MNPCSSSEGRVEIFQLRYLHQESSSLAESYTLLSQQHTPISLSECCVTCICSPFYFKCICTRVFEFLLPFPKTIILIKTLLYSIVSTYKLNFWTKDQGFTGEIINEHIFASSNWDRRIMVVMNYKNRKGESTK